MVDKSENGCTTGEAAPGDADVSMSPRNGHDPNCPKLNSAENSVEGKKGNNSQNRGSLQESNVEGKKRRRRGRRRRRNNNTNRTSSVQNSSLQPGAGEAGLVTTADKNNTPDSERKKSKKKRKRNQVGVTEAPLLDDVSSAERKDVGGTGSIGKMDGEVQPGLSEEANRFTKNMGSSVCESEEVTANNVSLTMIQGVELNAKAKADCLHARSGKSGVISKTSTSGGNPKAGPADCTGKASLPPSPIRGVIEVASSAVPSKQQNCQLYSSDGGPSFSFQNRDSVLEDGLAGCRDAHMHGSTNVCRSSSLSCTGTKRNGLHEKEVACSSTDHDLTCTGPSRLGHAHQEKVRHIYSPRGSLIRFQRKKLLILDLNGLLADINQDHHNAHMSHAKVRGKLVFKRPYYDDFLRFCFQNFELGIWSSRMKANVDSVVNILMKDLKQYLLFCWDLSKCTATGCKTLENKNKPLVLKELKKLWNKEEPDLPWEQGEFSPSNTLLVDDSPYKAVRNPPHTAIFPHPYSYRNKRDDSLGPGGDLRVYLENLATADDVQCYVREHPFGQPSITESDPHWNFYVQILDKLDKSLACRS